LISPTRLLSSICRWAMIRSYGKSILNDTKCRRVA
jgi:hypothetical protein